MIQPIQVWDYHQAPEELKLSDNGGDEDWLALVPPGYECRYIQWLETPHFACCDVQITPHPTLAGYTIHIGSHS